jgi:hypothetical protein
MRRLAFLLAAIVPSLTTPTSTGADPKPALIESKALDKILADTLREVHNRGADLYNAGEHLGCYRMFQGALQTARGLLAHRPEDQKRIDEGLAAADRQPAISQRAFALHELIESLRADLRGETPKLEPKTSEPPLAEDKKDSQKMPGGPKLEPALPEQIPEPRKTPKEQPLEPKKPPLLKDEPKPEPEKKDKKDAPADKGSPFADARIELPKPVSGVGGRVLFQGKPLPGVEVTFVSRGQVEPRVFEGSAAPDGTYFLPNVKPGAYTVLLTPGPDKTAGGLPERYALTNTSPLVVEVKPGGDTVDFVLQ